MIPKENLQVVYKNRAVGSEIGSRTLRIIHFNDIYNVEGTKEEPVGGAARFASVLDSLNEVNPDHLILFSGDAFSPSTLSLSAKGRQMVDCLNRMKLHAAVIGNHEFDMGVHTMTDLVDRSNFPWLLSNVLDHNTMKSLCDFDQKLVVNINGVKIGLFGLAEKDWVKSLSAINFDDVIFESYVEMGRKFAKELREKEKCDIVIALTHMLWDNDEKLVRKVPEIDIVLGGHNHDYGVKKIGERWLIKSGTDFKELTRIKVDISKEKKVTVRKIIKVTVDSKIQEKPAIKEIVDKYLVESDKALDEMLGVINTSLDGRTDSVRNFETNLGNFMCDIILSAVTAECAILNGGSLRSNQIHPAGVFKRRDLRNILPFGSELNVVEVKGSDLHQILENCVAKYGQGGGRYPQVSGIFFAFDVRKPADQRINPKCIKIQDEYLDLERTYLVASNTFLSSVDPIMKNCKIATSSENVPFLYQLVENHFHAINHINNSESSSSLSLIKPPTDNQNRTTKTKMTPRPTATSLVPRIIVDSIVNKLAKDPDVLPVGNPQAAMRQHTKLHFKIVAQIVINTLKARNVLLKSDRRVIKTHDKFREQMRQYEAKCLSLAPEVEGRSIQIKNDATLQSLLAERELYELKVKKQSPVPVGVQRPPSAASSIGGSSSTSSGFIKA